MERNLVLCNLVCVELRNSFVIMSLHIKLLIPIHITPYQPGYTHY